MVKLVMTVSRSMNALVVRGLEGWWGKEVNTLGVQTFFNGIIVFGIAWVVKCTAETGCSHFVGKC